MFPTRIGVVVFVIYIYSSHCNALKGRNKQGFGVVLENVEECKHPSPPYTKKITIMAKYKIVVENGTQYLSGNTTITGPTRFLNFSGRTFAVDSAGKRVIKFQISQVSCRNILARAIIQFSNLSVSSNKCLLNKLFGPSPTLSPLYDCLFAKNDSYGNSGSGSGPTGFFRYDNMDFNKVMHALPGWHAPGDVIHELQLVTDGATDFCTVIKVKITD